MEAQEGFERRRPRKVRVKVRTNRGLDFLTAVRADATISDLANRALSVYMELSEDGRAAGIKKQLTVSAVKQGIFYMPKSELVASLLNHDDEVEVVIIKAKPKYPNQLFQNQQLQPPPPKLHVNRPEMHPVPSVLEEKEESEMKEIVVAREDVISEREADRVSTISKRQRKKEKKQQKQRLKQQAKQKQLDSLKIAQKEPKQSNLVYKSQIKPQQPSESKPLKEPQLLQESNPRKRLKFDKEQTIQRPIPLVVPSPKITFHNEPRLQSPKFTLLSESSKKKWEGQMRKQSEEAEKRSQLEKMISPVMASRSPLIYQRSPMMPLSDSKPREKDELANFSLTFRKLSEDKKLQAKKEKDKEVALPSPRNEDLKGSVKKDEEKELTPIDPPERSAEKKQPEKEPEKREVMVEKKVEPVKVKATNMIVVEQDDSDSQENKKTNGHYQHHRQKELIEIQQKISEFLIESDED